MLNFNPYSYNALPVASMEEAKNSPIDYSGNPVFYFNRVDNEVYIKRFDMLGSGKVFFGKYVFEELPEEKVAKDEINEIKNQVNELKEILEKLENDIKVVPHPGPPPSGREESKKKVKEEKAVKDDK